MTQTTHAPALQNSLPVVPSWVIAIWRAHVQTPARDLPFFVQAGGYDEAMGKVLAVANCIVKPAEDAVYNLRSASDLMDDGVSSDRIARLFETGQS